jgi:Tfp pilus assembly protein PilF
MLDVQLLPIAPSNEVLIAVFGNTLSDEELTQARKEISAFYQSRKSKIPFRLVDLSAGDLQFSGPFKTRVLLQKALDAMKSARPETPQMAPLKLYTGLADLAPLLGSNWSIAILVGRFPDLDADEDPFTEAWLSARFRAAKVRASYWTPSGDISKLMNATVSSTGGMRLDDGLAELRDLAEQTDGFREISWSGAVPAESFRVCPVSLLGSNGVSVVNVTYIASAPGVTVPDLERYATFRENLKTLEALTKGPGLTAEQVAQAETALNVALEIAPREESTFRLGADLYRRSRNDAKLGSTLDTLTQLAPNDAALFAELGHLRFRMQDMDGADRALLRARELQPGDPGVSEELASIRLGREDDRGAIPFLEETLAAGQPTQELWLLRADALTRIGDWQKTADSVEHAIQMGGASLERRTALVRLYIEHQLPGRALFHVRAVAETLPADARIRAEYARFLDDLLEPQEALLAWRRALDADPKLELAHYRITRLLIDKPDLAGGLAAATAGIEAAPQSARLYLAKAEILEKQDRFYDSRQTLRDAAPGLPDPSLLARLADIEDAGGDGAARYFRKLAEVSGNDAAARADALKRGLEAAFRDGDLENAAWFQARLGAKSAVASNTRSGSVIIPGGLSALSFAAESKTAPPDLFLVEYARAVIPRLQFADKRAVEAYREKIREHFRRISELAAIGSKSSGRVTVTLSVQDKNGQKNAERVLDLLGWKMHTVRQGVKLEPPEKASKASRQETASALAIDEIGMETNLEAGQTFSFEIPMDSAKVMLGEEVWKAQFYPRENLPGGLAEAIANDLQLAETYAALGQMDPSTSSVLVSGLGLKTLAEKYAAQLWEYASALAVERGHAAVPGGAAAEAIWTKLTGVNPAQPGPFFRSLLTKDDGKMLAYYAALSELDIRHQRMFTRNLARATKFYELYKDSPEVQHSTSKHTASGSFTEFLAEVPLDDSGNVDFPGSPEVWMVAKGQSHSTSGTTKILKKLKRTVAPEVEDEILLRLASTRYRERGEHSELDNFLAVVRIDGHRTNPLDEASVLSLAQHFAEDGAAYPYFSILTGLEPKQFEQFFELAAAVRSLSNEERSEELATIHSLIKIVCIAQQVGSLNETQAAAVFGDIVERLHKAMSSAARTSESLNLVRDILGLINGRSDPDAAIRTLLQLAGARQKRFQQVLELQKVPSLSTVFTLSDAARNLGAGKGATQQEIQTLESRSPGLNFLEVPKELKLNAKEKSEIEGFQPRRLEEIVKQFRDKTSRKKVNPQDLEKLSRDYIAEIDAPVRWALAGIVYAYYLRPDDLVVSEDPLLLRKHRFYEKEQIKEIVFEAADLEASSEKAGSFFRGGFANFGDVAGKAAAKGAKLGGPNGEVMAAKQISTIRSTNWGPLRDEDLRLFGLKVTVAKEWLVHAATQPEVESSLAEDSLGLLSLTRRAELLSALAGGDWSTAWNLVTLSDLYFLADRYLQRYSKDPWESSATRALRGELTRNDGSRLQLLGPEFDDIFGCSHPHLRSTFPYEQYESDLFPTRIAERTAEFKLYLARYADLAGIPAAGLEELVEPTARAILKRMQMTDLRDWRSALAGYAALDRKLVEEVAASR